MGEIVKVSWSGGKDSTCANEMGCNGCINWNIFRTLNWGF